MSNALGTFRESGLVSFAVIKGYKKIAIGNQWRYINICSILSILNLFRSIHNKYYNNKLYNLKVVAFT